MEFPKAERDYIVRVKDNCTELFYSKNGFSLEKKGDNHKSISIYDRNGDMNLFSYKGDILSYLDENGNAICYDPKRDCEIKDDKADYVDLLNYCRYNPYSRNRTIFDHNIYVNGSEADIYIDNIGTKINAKKLFQSVGVVVEENEDLDVTGIINDSYLYLIHDTSIIRCRIINGKIIYGNCYIEGKLANHMDNYNFFPFYKSFIYSSVKDGYITFYKSNGSVLFKDYAGEEFRDNYGEYFSTETENGIIIAIGYEKKNKSRVRIYEFIDSVKIPPLSIPDNHLERLYYEKDNFPSDITIHCLDGDLEAHRFILILHSEYLDSCLTNKNFLYTKEIKTEFSMDIVSIALKIIYGIIKVNDDGDIISNGIEEEKGDEINDSSIIPLLILGDQWISKTIVYTVLKLERKRYKTFISEWKKYKTCNISIPENISSFIEGLELLDRDRE